MKLAPDSLSNSQQSKSTYLLLGGIVDCKLYFSIGALSELSYDLKTAFQSVLFLGPANQSERRTGGGNVGRHFNPLKLVGLRNLCWCLKRIHVGWKKEKTVRIWLTKPFFRVFRSKSINKFRFGLSVCVD